MSLPEADFWANGATLGVGWLGVLAWQLRNERSPAGLRYRLKRRWGGQNLWIAVPVIAVIGTALCCIAVPRPPTPWWPAVAGDAAVMLEVAGCWWIWRRWTNRRYPGEREQMLAAGWWPSREIRRHFYRSGFWQLLGFVLVGMFCIMSIPWFGFNLWQGG